jgi:structural maintenance of chromosome 2
LSVAKETYNSWKMKFEETSKLFNAEKQKCLQADSEVKKLSKDLDKLQKRRNEAELDLKKLTTKSQRLEKEKEAESEKVKVLLRQHQWISSESHLFGKAHTDYDFSKQSPKQAHESLNKKKSEQTKLSKNVNKAVVNMKQKAEEEYKNLMSRRERIEKDKQKIEEVIAELDVKKNEALYKTWEKVNKDFGSIFSTLLPGTSAKLEPPEGMDVLEGLEVRVAFGKVWKESLSELSGGQRSLLALSLILSLLLYKPAPMYILDEVDAALDLSHTQNIGRMLKTHFSQSQFIVVSLKDGMFNNANVLFRTKFVEGVSTVSRTVNINSKARK